MAVQFDNTGAISLGGSSINPRNVSNFQRGGGENYAGRQAMQLAQSLEGLTGSLSAMKDKQAEDQLAQTDMYVAQIQAGFGSQATSEDINNITSPLHAKVRQRVTEDYMYGVGSKFAQSYIENMPYDTMMAPEQEAAYYNEMRAAALKEAGGDPLRAAGFMKGLQAQIGQREQQNSASRTSQWTQIQKDAYGNNLMMGADAVAAGSVVPQLSTAITTTAQKYQAPWLVQFLTRSAQIESRGGRDLSNPNSSARGPFQFISSTAKQYGLVDPMDFDTSTDAAARLAMDNYATLKNGLGREPTMAELYLAHQQGSGGALKLLSNPTANAVDVVGKEAVRLNGGSPNMTAGQFAGKWTGKFGGDNSPLNTDPTAVIIPAEAQALREHFFGVDGEYKLTGSLNNGERRDIAANVFLTKALELRDPNFLLGMPEELMTPDIRAKYAQAQDSIASMKMSDIRDQEAAKALQEKQVQRDVAFEVINLRASGKSVDPMQLAIDPATGFVDPLRLEAANAAVQMGGNLVSDVNSVRAAGSYKDSIRNAFLTGDYSKMPGLTFSGEQPTMDDLRGYVLSRPDINDKERTALFNSVEGEVSKVSFVQRQDVNTWFTAKVGSSVDALMKSPIGAAVAIYNPNLEGQVRDVYEMSLFHQIEAQGGVPIDITKILKTAEQEAMSVVTTARLAALEGASTTPAPATPTPAVPVDPNVSVLPIGEEVTDSDGNTWTKIKDGADSDINNWELKK